MNQSIRLILAAAAADSVPEDYTIARLDYGVDGDRLSRGPQADSAAVRPGSLMAVSAQGDLGGTVDFSRFCAEALSECAEKGYSGLVADFEFIRSDSGLRLLRALEQALGSRGLSFYVPESYGDQIESALVLVSTAISGGSLSQRLNEAIDRFGSDRVCPMIQRVSMDFTIPALSGIGRILSASELEALISQRAAASFFSNELCINYFTYRDRRQTHVVLYDNAGSIGRKIRLASGMGLTEVFLYHTEVRDMLRHLSGGARPGARQVWS